MSRADRCRWVRGWLPAHAAGTLGGWRTRLVDRHLARCESCRAEAGREQAVAAGLEQLEAVVAESPADPPPDLLDELLAQAHQPGWRARAAVPARGAVSGARPGWSVVLGAVTLALAAATGYAAWRAWRAMGNPERR